MRVLFSLVGEQPMPNLLVAKHEQPQILVLAHTEATRAQAERIARVWSGGEGCVLVSVAAYDPAACRDALCGLITGCGWQSHDVAFNVTGGTKLMSVGAIEAARAVHKSVFYLQSDAQQNLLSRYEFTPAGTLALAEQHELSQMINIDEYIRVHVESYCITGPSKSKGGAFERTLHGVLARWVDEIVLGVQLNSALQVDLVVRCGNHVGVIEVKTGTISKKGIDQLNTAGGQKFLGTYNRKMLICDRPWDKSSSDLATLARATGITVHSAPSYRASGTIDPTDASRLGQEVRAALAGGRRAS